MKKSFVQIQCKSIRKRSARALLIPPSAGMIHNSPLLSSSLWWNPYKQEVLVWITGTLLLSHYRVRTIYTSQRNPPSTSPPTKANLY